VSLLEKFLGGGTDNPAELPDKIRLVVGLGNPGAEYESTRHNIGFELVDRLATESDSKWSRERKFRAKVAKSINGVILAKPLTYMNLSGNAVARLGRFYKLQPSQILVVYDDLDLSLGSIRFRKEGSSGGHNGIKSIIEFLHTKEFPRMKLGIGVAGENATVIGHVLGKFSKNDQEELEKVLAIAVDGVNCALSGGMDQAMNQFNRRA
jgi:PTH1 family peptidyl-tRNA hydrolase